MAGHTSSAGPGGFYFDIPFFNNDRRVCLPNDQGLGRRVCTTLVPTTPRHQAAKVSEGRHFFHRFGRVFSKLHESKDE
jgi:hypothetical protein